MPANHLLVCIHDVSPAFEREVRTMVSRLEPTLGRSFSMGVVPAWHGQWPLAAHRSFTTFVRDRCAELLLHGVEHRRARGRGAVSLLTDGADEMNGLDERATLSLLQRGQRLFADAFGAPSRGFLPPTWQRGRVHDVMPRAGFDYSLGFLRLHAPARSIPLATWSWDCGRWGVLGHVGDAVGQALSRLNGRVPVLALHPRDLARGFLPRIERTLQSLLARGYTPTIPRALCARDRATSTQLVDAVP